VKIINKISDNLDGAEIFGIVYRGLRFACSHLQGAQANCEFYINNNTIIEIFMVKIIFVLVV